MKVLSVLLVGAALLLSGLLRVSEVQAQDSFCDDLVYQDTSFLSSGELTSVRTEAEKLQNSTASEVRVRVFATTRGAHIEDFVKQIESQCRSWRGPEGQTKNNLIAILITTQEHDFLIWTGAGWEKALPDSKLAKIAADKLVFQLQSGNKGLAFTESLKEINNQINLFQNPPPINSTGGGNEVNFNFGGFAKVFGIVSGAVIAIVLMILGYIFLSRRAKKEEARRKAKHAAETAKNTIGTTLSNLGGILSEKRLLVESLKTQVHTDDIAETETLLNEAQMNFDRASGEFAKLSEVIDPSDPKLSVGEYGNIQAEYERIATISTAAETAFNAASSLIGSLQEVRSEIPGRVSALTAFIEDARSRVKAIKDQGFKVDAAESKLAEADSTMAEAQQSVAEKKFFAASDFEREAIDLIANSVTLAAVLPEKKTELEQKIAALEARIEQTKVAIIAAGEVFDAIEAEYAEDSFVSIVGNGTESENRVNNALEGFSNAQTFVHMDRQDWDGAEEEIGRANISLDQADSFIRSIHALKQSLDQAKASAATEVNQTFEALQKAATYLQENLADIKGHYHDDLEKAQEILGRAEAELAETRPNFLLAVKLADQSEDIANEVLKASSTEVENAERLRQKAKRALREAKVSYSKAAEFIEDHSGDVGRNARVKLADAHQELISAEDSSNDLESSIAWAVEAEKSANLAYSSASRDFKEKEQERRHREKSYPSWGTTGSMGRWSTGRSSGHSSGGISIGNLGGVGRGISGSFGGGGGGRGISGKW